MQSSWCCGHGCYHCAVWESWSLVALPGVLQSWLLRCVGCRSCSCCTTWGVMVAVVVPCGVSQSWLLRCIGCHSHGCCTAWGVVVAVVAPCGVSQSQLLHHMGCCGHSCCTTWGVAVIVVAPCRVFISKKEPAYICTYYALLCLTGTCKAFVRKFL
jgi:hypothetical protein